MPHTEFLLTTKDKQTKKQPDSRRSHKSLTSIHSQKLKHSSKLTNDINLDRCGSRNTLDAESRIPTVTLKCETVFWRYYFCISKKFRYSSVHLNSLQTWAGIKLKRSHSKRIGLFTIYHKRLLTTEICVRIWVTWICEIRSSAGSLWNLGPTWHLPGGDWRASVERPPRLVGVLFIRGRHCVLLNGTVREVSSPVAQFISRVSWARQSYSESCGSLSHKKRRGGLTG